MKKELSTLIFLGLFLPTFILAQITIENPLKAKTFEELINNIIDFIFYVAMALAPLMVLIGAFYIMSAGGNPKRVETGKNIILYTVIGLVIVFLAKAIVFMIRQVLTG